MKYKIGDIVTIDNNDGGSKFPIGEQVRIIEIKNDWYKAEYLNQTDWLWIYDNNIKDTKLSAKEFLLSRYIPTTSDEERALWYQTYDWAVEVVRIMDEYRNQ